MRKDGRKPVSTAVKGDGPFGGAAAVYPDSNVVPIRSAAELTVSPDTLPEDLVAVITASDESFAETIAAIRRCYGFASPKTLDAMAEAHSRLAALAIGLARAL